MTTFFAGGIHRGFQVCALCPQLGMEGHQHLVRLFFSGPQGLVHESRLTKNLKSSEWLIQSQSYMEFNRIADSLYSSPLSLKRMCICKGCRLLLPPILKCLKILHHDERRFLCWVACGVLLIVYGLSLCVTCSRSLLRLTDYLLVT